GPRPGATRAAGANELAFSLGIDRQPAAGLRSPAQFHGVRGSGGGRRGDGGFHGSVRDLTPLLSRPVHVSGTGPHAPRVPSRQPPHRYFLHPAAARSV